MARASTTGHGGNPTDDTASRNTSMADATASSGSPATRLMVAPYRTAGPTGFSGFGAATGTTLPAKIYFCAPDAKTNMFYGMFSVDTGR